MHWKNWFVQEGPELLKKLGIKKDEGVLDFGSGSGDYSIPLAHLVGKNGKIIAIDKDSSKITKLTARKHKYGLNNLTIIKTDGSLDFELQSNSLDKCVVFDVLHYFDLQTRIKVYREIKRILKPEGLFITFPQHNKESYAMMNFANLTFNDIINEIEQQGFTYSDSYEGQLLHDHYWYDGKVLIFKIRLSPKNSKYVPNKN